MGQALQIRLPSPRPWQRLIQRAAGSRLASWFLPYLLHRLDLLILRLSSGKLTATSALTGLPVVLLKTVGARSGTCRETPLVGIPDGEKVVLIASAFGHSRHPAWYHNLRADSVVSLAYGGRQATYQAREIMGFERHALWQRAVEIYPGYRAYQDRAGARRIPVMALEPVDM